MGRQSFHPAHVRLGALHSIQLQSVFSPCLAATSVAAVMEKNERQRAEQEGDRLGSSQVKKKKKANARGWCVCV